MAQTPSPAGQSPGGLTYWTEAGTALANAFIEAGEHIDPGERPNIPYTRASSSWLAGGIGLRRGASVGAKVILTPLSVENTSFDTAAIIATASYRLFKTRGFYLSGGAGVGLLSDSVRFDDGEESGAGSKGLFIELGAGWEWKLRGPVSVRAEGTQRMLSLGTLPTGLPGLVIRDVIVNYWAIGGSVVFRTGR